MEIKGTRFRMGSAWMFGALVGCSLAAFVTGFFAHGQESGAIPSHVVSVDDPGGEVVAPDWPAIGAIRSRHARDIEANPWSVGAETMDRGYTDYQEWKPYLGPLGAKKARVQAGWARTEKVRGVYDFAWLDSVVFDMPKRGVEPWVNLSYGNPVYQGGGGYRLGAALPKSEEAIAGWLDWVRANVDRYQEVVDEWEIWNEPAHGNNSPQAYARLLIETAEVIREVQPEAQIIAFAMAGINVNFAEEVLQILAERDKLHLIDEVTYHPYSYNPDSNYDRVEELRQVVRRFAPHATIRQGENGAPSSRRSTKALRDHDWTEHSQAKWALRRLLGDFARGIPSSYFSIVDLRYPDEMNTKGLLEARDDLTVVRPKPAYDAVQHVTAIFDSEVSPTDSYRLDVTAPRPTSAFVLKESDAEQPLLLVWFDDETPAPEDVYHSGTVRIEDATYEDPVYVDMLSGSVLDIPPANFRQESAATEFQDIPLYDSPILIGERATLADVIEAL